MEELVEQESGEDIVYDQSKQDLPPKDIQQQVKEQEFKKYGTLSGVFIPTLLTILGVIMFLREGWVVGNAGLIGSFLVITLSFVITSCTAFSMSSFVTNTRVGAGGAFSIVSQALGLEIGGSIGIPLFISQAIAVSMYVFGFRAGWLWIFPEHSPLLIDIGTFLAIVAITMVSTSFAFRIQYGILLVILSSLFSIFLAAIFGSLKETPELWGSFPGSLENDFRGISFWGVFAVFFPASTGIMAGANMSGELKNPRKSIPLGTISAIALSYLIYMLLAYWLASSATTGELIKNYTVMIDKAYWSPPVLAGLLAATFSSALSSFIGAPRILQALGAHNILFRGDWIAKRTKSGEPRNAIFVTCFIVLLALMMRDLNLIAPLITMIFLITYCVINFVVILEQQLQLISFRPSLKVPKIISIVGFIGSIFAMFIISPIFGLLATGFIGSVYFVLLRRQLKAPFSDVRSGLFVAFAEWAAKKVKLLHGRSERAWKPNILLPIEDINRLKGVFRLVYHLAKPIGSVKILGIQPKEKLRDFELQLENESAAYLKRGVFSSCSVIEEEDFAVGITLGIQALRGAFFRPNLLFLELPKDPNLHKRLWKVLEVTSYSKMGAAIIVDHPQAALGRREKIHLWIPKQQHWEVSMHFDNLDLAVLLAYRLKDSWDGELSIFVHLENKKEKKEAEKFLRRLIHLSRLPVKHSQVIVCQSLVQAVGAVDHADLNIFPLEEKMKVSEIWKIRDACNSTLLLTKDSGIESAIA
ncbi:MAG: amino acid permease [Chlamydiales bacterium]